MKKTLFILGLFISPSTFSQINPNWNPDYNGNGTIGSEDLLGLLTEFGSEFNFISPCDSIVIEQNACNNENFVSYYEHTYDVVAIGNQCWFAENLRTDKYSNGDVIPYWFQGQPPIDEGQYCVYEHTNDTFGYLYTFYAASDERNLCPSGWHVPTYSEWNILGDYIGVDSLESGYSNVLEWLGTNQGTELKSISWNGIDSWGFNGQPGGMRNMEGFWSGIGAWAHWWSTTSIPATGNDVSWGRALKTDSSQILYTGFNNQDGHSIRCIKD